MLRSVNQVAESNNNEVIGFIASTVETMRDDMASMREQMATKEDLARVEGRLNERLSSLDGSLNQKLASLDGRLSERIEVATTSVRGDLEQVQLRLDSMEHSIVSRFEHVEGELSRLRSAVYLLGKDDPDVRRLLGHQPS
jgi:hypothetical protein